MSSAPNRQPRAVVTLTIGEFHQRMSAITHPTLAAYARRTGADFLVWREHEGYRLPHYRKMELAGLLDQYPRVLYLDTDLLVRDDTPDLFELVPEGQMGAVEEGLYDDRQTPTLQLMQLTGQDSSTWDGRYFNTGVMVLSQAQKCLFVRPPYEYDYYKEQTYLNCMIARTGTKVLSLPYQFNRIPMMDFHYPDQRFDCYIIHYAGIPLSKQPDDQLALMRHDLEVWQAMRPGMKGLL